MSSGVVVLRRHRRLHLDLSNESGSQKLKDMSLGGMRVHSSRRLHLDESIEVNLGSPLGPVTVRGTVVRARRTGADALPYEYGVAFAPLSGDEAARVEALLAARGSHEEGPGELEPGELESLCERIADLEAKLAAARARAAELELAVADSAPNLESSGGYLVAAAGPPPTCFERDRFVRLLAAGQPLMPLVERPSEHVDGALHQVVAAALTTTVELDPLARVLRTSASRDTVVGVLATFYDRGLVDFA